MYEFIIGMLYSAIEQYRQNIESPYSNDDWLTWISSIRLAKRYILKELGMN